MRMFFSVAQYTISLKKLCCNLFLLSIMVFSQLTQTNLIVKLNVYNEACNFHGISHLFLSTIPDLNDYHFSLLETIEELLG